MQKTRIVFGLGSNLGEREFYLDEALRELKNQLCLTDVKKSSILKNPAMLLPDSPAEWNCEFFNIAVSGDIDVDNFPPLEILKIVKEIEKKLGRKERGRWAPREIDIDILLIGKLRIDLPGLVVPHAGLFEREFFLKTVGEIETFHEPSFLAAKGSRESQES